MKWNFKLSKSIRLTKLIVLFISLISSQMSFAQPQQTIHSFSYYKILPGKDHEFRSMMEAVDSRVQKERLNNGAISAWYLYEVVSPSGTNAEYDYVAVTTTNSIKKAFESSYPFVDAFKKSFPGKDAKFFADYFSKLNGICRLVKEEVYGGTAVADSSSHDGFKFKYLVVDFMQPKPDKFGEYFKMELDTFRLVHKERIKLGALSQWALLQLSLPFDVKTGYSTLAISFYNDLDMMYGDSKYEEGIKKNFPNVSLNNLFQSAATTRDNPKADLLRLVFYAMPGK